MNVSDITSYGALCIRVGECRARAIFAVGKDKKKEAKKHWKAYYDADREKEKCLKKLLRALGLRTMPGSGRSSASMGTRST